MTQLVLPGMGDFYCPFCKGVLQKWEEDKIVGTWKKLKNINKEKMLCCYNHHPRFDGKGTRAWPLSMIEKSLERFSLDYMEEFDG